MRLALRRGPRTRVARRWTAVAVAPLAALAAGCGGASGGGTRSTPAAVASAAATRAYDADSAARFAPGVISDSLRQWRITFTPDGATAYFAESDGAWSAPRTTLLLATTGLLAALLPAVRAARVNPVVAMQVE